LAGATEEEAAGATVDDEERVDAGLEEMGGAMEELGARLDETAAIDGLAARVEELVVRLVEELVVRLVEELVVRLEDVVALVEVLAVEVLDEVRMVDGLRNEEDEVNVTGLREVIVVVDELTAAWPMPPVTVTTTTTVRTSVSVRMRNDVRTAWGSARAPAARAEAKKIEQRIAVT